jgi:hypothetical protein
MEDKFLLAYAVVVFDVVGRAVWLKTDRQDRNSPKEKQRERQAACLYVKLQHDQAEIVMEQNPCLATRERLNKSYAGAHGDGSVTGAGRRRG